MVCLLAGAKLDYRRGLLFFFFPLLLVGFASAAKWSHITPTEPRMWPSHLKYSWGQKRGAEKGMEEGKRGKGGKEADVGCLGERGQIDAREDYSRTARVSIETGRVVVVAWRSIRKHGSLSSLVCSSLEEEEKRRHIEKIRLKSTIKNINNVRQPHKKKKNYTWPTDPHGALRDDDSDSSRDRRRNKEDREFQKPLHLLST